MPPFAVGRVLRGVGRYLDDFNPWLNVRLFGTNIGNDILSGLTVAVIALALMKLERCICYTTYSVVPGFMCGISAIIILFEDIIEKA